jgi:hypothetical protein
LVANVVSWPTDKEILGSLSVGRPASTDNYDA